MIGDWQKSEDQLNVGPNQQSTAYGGVLFWEDSYYRGPLGVSEHQCWQILELAGNRILQDRAAEFHVVSNNMGQVWLAGPLSSAHVIPKEQRHVANPS